MFGSHFRYSVAICAYYLDEPDYLFEAIASMCNQSVLPEDISLVFDGPTPPNFTYPVNSAKKLCDSKSIEFNFLALPSSVGPGLARNIAIANTRTDIISLMDADDLSHPGRMLKQLEILWSRPAIQVVCSSAIEAVFLDGNYDQKGTIKRCPETPAEIASQLRWTCPVCTPSLSFYKRCWFDCGGFPALSRSGEDHFFMLSLIHKGFNFYCIQDPLVTVRTSDLHLRRRHGFTVLYHDIVFRVKALSSGYISPLSAVLGVAAAFARRLLPSKVGYTITLLARSFSLGIQSSLSRNKV